MTKLYKFLFFFFFTIITYNAFCQEGTPLITNFTFGELSIDNESWAMAQDFDGQMLFANRRGIVTYDGMKWETIVTPSVPLSLYFDPVTKKIFVGCKNNFGLLHKDVNGNYKYISLLILKKDLTNIGDITAITSIEQNIYFYCSSSITRFSTREKNFHQWVASSGEPFTGLLVNNDLVYVNVNNLGLHLLKENVKVPVREGYKFSNNKVLFNFRYSRAQTLIGMDNDSLYLFNGSQIAPFYFESSHYIKENVLSGGINIDKNSFALSTVTGGFLIIDKNTNKSIFTINYQNGLPDDEIYSMGIDQNKGIWALHEFGMSRIDLQLPVRSLNNYPGLEGNLTTIIEVDSILYVATSEGVYYLSEVENYGEIEVLVKVNDKKEKKIEGENTPPKVFEDVTDKVTKKEEQPIEQDKKGGFFKKLFGSKKNKKNKTKNNDSSTNQNDETDETILNNQKEQNITKNDSINNQNEKPAKDKIKKPKNSNQNNTSTLYEKQKLYALQSISHRFVKINGIEGKVKQLVEYKNKILVATNVGLYQIENFKSKVIISSKYINYILPTKLNSNKFYIGASDGIFITEYKNKHWETNNEFPELIANIYSIFEASNNSIWLGSENIAYNLLLDNEGNMIKLSGYPIKSDFTERILVRGVLGTPYFFLSTGLYSYDQNKDSIVFNSKTNKGFTGQSKYIFTQDNITWIFNEFKWLSLHKLNKYATLPVEFLELFDNITNIYVDPKNNVYVIDNNNSIFKILNSKKKYEEIFNVYLRSIYGKHDKLLSLDNLVMDYNNSSIRFQISAPYFVRPNAISFQFFVEGLTPTWSDWKNDVSIDFPYLPDGDYKLKIKAKNILGTKSSMKSFHFTITPPFWKNWWFYLLCLMGAGIVVWVIITYREREMKRYKKLLEDKIKFRTEELVLEKAKTDELLLNILPQETALELQRYGKARARQYDFASVMFTDFKEFTILAEKLSPKDLVKEIDYCFANFDDIIGKYKIEKIKTIGDSYMCAAGIPIKDSTNPITLTLAGLDIIQFMNKYKKNGSKYNSPFFELRMGIHTGPLVTGVVGKKKFAYDIWGDTVNIAARLEESGEVGMLNISECTYMVIKDYFDCEYRGKFEVKNKGYISMYFVNRIKEKFSKDKEGLVANDALLQIINIKNN